MEANLKLMCGTMVVSELDSGGSAINAPPPDTERSLSMQPQFTISPLFGDPRLPVHFWARVRVLENGCWEWIGAQIPKGYGQIRYIKRRQILTHRLAWEELSGPIPDGLYVCHHCDNPPCVRLDHLFLGTQADNMEDMMLKGRGRSYD